CEPSPRWLRRLGVIAFIAVVVQGILGGLRVTQMMDQLGIFHATLAQLFFLLLSSIALFHTRFWRKLDAPAETAALENKESSSIDRSALKLAGARAPVFLATTCLILAQLVLGATMRHQHAGLAIPDFPTAYGKLWPATDSESVHLYNQQRITTQ